MTTIITVRGKWFAGRVETIRVRVESDGTVLAWDSVAGHYTRCHSASARLMARARRLAAAR